ncbi:MAG: hypothetical protein ACHQDY_07575 [Solirubrobacterales bacterium]
MDIEAQRTLVKSPPELWALVSDSESLSRHLVEFGEIRIVSAEPETAVAWEGQDVSGTVQLEASGWGTRVTITATRQPPKPAAPAEPEPEPIIEPEPVVAPEPVLEDASAPEAEPGRRPGFFARLFRRRRRRHATPEPEATLPEPAPEPEPEPRPEATEPEQPDLSAELQALEESMAAETTALLTAVLDRLGAAHHRPFSRA